MPTAEGDIALGSRSRLLLGSQRILENSSRENRLISQGYLRGG